MTSAAPSWLVGLVGSGIGPSLSPALHEHEADALGLRYLYRRIDLDVLRAPASSVGELLAAARTTGFDGLNVTHPCKQLVVGHLDGLSPDAAALGAVNTVVLRDGRAVGHNTDWSGFAQGFRRGLPAADLDRVVLIGTGGAGAAVAHALVRLGVRELVVVDADPTRARGLTATLAGVPGTAVSAADLSELPARLRSCSGVVHATPTGMAAHPGAAFDVALLPATAWVADVVYRPLRTRLVLDARAAGHRVLDGGAMAVFQAAESFRLFTDVDPDVDRMFAHFTELVT